MGNLTIARLASNPILVYSIAIPEPETWELTEYEESAFPAVFGNLLGLSIGRVSPYLRLGRVMSFDVTPRQTPDPIIIYSRIGNLKPYYTIWADTMKNGVGYYRNGKIRKYDDSISSFLQSVKELADTPAGLSTHEIVFATIEMLKFKNDVLLNPNFE